MIQFPNIPLPTSDLTDNISPTDAQSIARSWLSSFASACSKADTRQIIADLLHPSTPFWRDALALTWDFRTLFSASSIAEMLEKRLEEMRPSDFVLNETYTGFQKPFPDLGWIVLMFSFQTRVGKCTGVVRLVPVQEEWKAYVVYTNLDSLSDYPEKLRNTDDSNPEWAAERESEVALAPKVILIGAGQSGLVTAARLKALGIRALVIEKNERIGDNWRERYDSLCLHDPVWYDHLPYLPFPATWPVYCHARKLANWLEHYADALDLPVWTSSTVTSLTQDPNTNQWHVSVLRTGQEERPFVVDHVIFCTGFGSPDPPVPSYPGLHDFKGQVIHSTAYKRADDHKNKKVLVVGACTSAHDIAMDCYNHGIDVTMFQRTSTYIVSTKSLRDVALKGLYSEDSPPVEIADRLAASFPLFASTETSRRSTAFIASLDKDTVLDPLHKVGFRTNLGYDDTGVLPMVLEKCGGYYFDTGACGLISQGKIKLKNDSQISHFTERSVVFENGSQIDGVDLVIFATGIGETKDRIQATLQAANSNTDTDTDTLMSKINPIWGVNPEGELNGVYGYHALGVPGLWYILGNLALCRFYSTHVALQIKALEVGIWDGVV